MGGVGGDDGVGDSDDGDDGGNTGNGNGDGGRWCHTPYVPVSNLFLVSYTKSRAVLSSSESSGCQKSMITT